MTTTTATRPRDALARVQPFHDLTVARARGSWYVDTEGHRYLDMLSGCWCSILGHNRRRRWAELLRMVFQVEVEVCARCGGEARILGFVTEPQVIRRILAHLERRGADARAGPWAGAAAAPG